MTRQFKHLAIPLVLTVSFFVVAATPVDLLGCRNRGLVAVSIALAGGLAGIGAAIKGLTGKIRGDKNSVWWMASALILAVPVAYLVLVEC